MRYSSRQSARLCRRASSTGPFFNAPVQAKLENDSPGDKYEQEADVMAGKVTSRNAPTGFFKVTPFRDVVNTGRSNYQTHVNNGGNNLDHATRNFMEPKFGYDFSKVKIHNDSTAHQSASNINALAYTHGNNIVFGAGQYQPGT